MNPSFLKFAEMLVEYELILLKLRIPGKAAHIFRYVHFDLILIQLSFAFLEALGNNDALIIAQMMNLQWLPLFPGWRSRRVPYVIFRIQCNKQVHLKDIVFNLLIHTLTLGISTV